MRYITLILFASLLLTSCTPLSTSDQLEDTHTVLAQLIETAVDRTVTTLPLSVETFSTPLPSSPKPIVGFDTAIPTKDMTGDVVDCWEIDAYVGSIVTCKIDHVYCSYQSDIRGQPTYCHDAPYPNHSFTLLIWGSDWSGYDGECIIIEGFVSRCEGKPQIVVESRSQVSMCR